MSNMRTNGEFSAGNKVFALYLCIFLAGVVGLWLAVHPKSPLRSYKEYDVLFTQVGTLHETCPVQVFGMKRGYVSNVTLRNDGVVAHLRIESQLNIPKDSRFRVVNSGLLGQREVEVRIGESNQFYASGDSLHGGYDEGSTRLIYMAKNLLGTADSTIQACLLTWDSTLGNPEVQTRISHLGTNGKSSVNKISRDMGQWRDSLLLLRSELHSVITELDSAKTELGPGIDSTIQGVKDLNQGLDGLAQQAQHLVTHMDWLTQQLQGSNNTAGLLINEQQLHDKIGTTMQDVRNLIQGIKQEGLNMNVDIHFFHKKR